jgi:hypothetical protein
MSEVIFIESTDAKLWGTALQRIEIASKQTPSAIFGLAKEKSLSSGRKNSTQNFSGYFPLMGKCSYFLGWK